MLTFDFEVFPFGFASETPPEDGCYVEGLFIEGCRWDGATGELAESEPKVLFSPVPPIWLKVRVQIIRHARTRYVGKSQSCMFFR